MNTLYVIGNGFDKAHGICTDYWDFRTFLETYYSDFLQEFERMYGIMPIDYSDPYYSANDQEIWNLSVNHKFWSVLEKEIGYPDMTAMESFSSSVVENLSLESGSIGIRDTMDIYWQQEYGFISKLQEHLKEWISHVDISSAIPRKNNLFENDEDYFLNFNYTETLEKIYHIQNVLHIHGGIGIASDIDPIIGHCNKCEIDQRRKLSKEADEIFSEGESSIQNAIADYLYETFKDTNFIIKQHDHFFQKLCSVDHVVLIGWSVGDVDVPYLCKIRDSIKKDAKWTICYYKEEEYTTIKRTLVQNSIYEQFKVDFLQTNMYWDC